MGTDIEVTEEEIARERASIQSWIDAVNNNTTTIEEFLENEAQVIAHLRADVRRMDAIIHRETKGINYCSMHGGHGFMSDCVTCNG